MLVDIETMNNIKGDIPVWMIAKALGIHENTVYRYIRSEDKDKKRLVLNAIEHIKEELRHS
ncbi:hypothetical protein JDS99_28470 [Bacillus cereus group sp. N6]|nr:hypothetical protein [Bacillus cereus group sp. N6]